VAEFRSWNYGFRKRTGVLRGRLGAPRSRPAVCAVKRGRTLARRWQEGSELRFTNPQDHPLELIVESLTSDVRFALRLLIKRPAFTLVAVVTLALGIGANTAIFSVVNGVLLRPLPYPQPDRLVTMSFQQSLPDLDDIRSQCSSFDYMGGAVMQAQDYTGAAEPLQVQVAMVNSDLFGALGVQPMMGRTISDEQDRYGGERVVVLTHGFWQSHFAADPAIVGRAIPLSGNSYTIIGVMPPEFSMPRETPDILASLRVVNPIAARERGVHFLRTYLRLKPGITLEQAQGDLQPIDQWLAEQYPEHNRDRHTTLVSLHERVVGNTRPALLILFGSVGLVLLIACANFANLLLANAASRQQELMIRQAVGASRVRLIRQFLTESVLISLLGGAAGSILAMWGIGLLVSLKPANLPRLSSVAMDASVFAFATAVSLLTGIVFGLMPALSAARVDLNEALKEGGRSATGGGSRSRMRSLLVVSEIALAVILLIGAGLLIKGFWLLRSVDPGFNPQDLLTLRIELPEARYKEIPKQNQFRDAVLDRLNSIPGVRAAMVSELPLSGDYLTHNFIIEGRPPIPKGQEPELPVRSVAGDYFRTMGIPLRLGRNFGPEDRADSPIVGLVNETFVRTYFAGENPIGARIRWARQEPPSWMTIVGVVGDVKQRTLNAPEEPAFYWSYEQGTQPWKRWMYLVVRGGQQPGMLDEVKTGIWAVDRLIPLTRVHSMEEVMASSVGEQRFNMTMMVIFGAVALSLAAVGVYGVMSYLVAQRTHEIGIRMALGANTLEVLGIVLRHALVLCGAGLAAGLMGAFALTRVMQGLLFGVSSSDPVTFIAISGVLVVVAIGASLVPASRAARVDPMVALRYE